MLTAAETYQAKTPEQWRAEWEAEYRAQEARLEWGRTVGDARRLMKRARRIMVAVRVGTDADKGDVKFLPTSPTNFRKQVRIFLDEEPMPCELDPATGYLTVGTLRAIEKAREAQSS